MKQTSDTHFTLDWLQLREPADHSARDAALLSAAAECVRDGRFVLDIGCGTGSTARAFALAGHGGLAWLFMDNDQRLLDSAASQHAGSQAVLGDIGDLDALPLQDVGLVTASALLDLMPRHWVDGLALRLGQAGIPLYAALNYNGDMRWDPALDPDDAVTAAFNDHQGRDKGLGPALGPASAGQTRTAFDAQGFTVQARDSPWVIGPDMVDLHHDLLRGIGAAAHEAGCGVAQNWMRARLDAAATTQAYIGHTDILAVPAMAHAP